MRGPLCLTVKGLMEAIDRRRQGMDVQQEEIRERIGRMLEESWLEAVRSWKELLVTTSGALQELHRALMHEIEGMSSLMNEIEELCEGLFQTEPVEAVAHVRRQMERISAWGGRAASRGMKRNAGPLFRRRPASRWKIAKRLR